MCVCVTVSMQKKVHQEFLAHLIITILLSDIPASQLHSISDKLLISLQTYIDTQVYSFLKQETRRSGSQSSCFAVLSSAEIGLKDYRCRVQILEPLNRAQDNWYKVKYIILSNIINSNILYMVSIQ